MSDSQERMHSVHNAALIGQEFLNAITAIAAKHQMSRPFVLSLFGMFAKRFIELEVADGRAEQEAEQFVIEWFLKGAGIESVFDSQIDKRKLQ